jgi:hypothetical protein
MLCMPSTRRRKPPSLPDDPFTIKRRNPVPHQFVLDALAGLEPITRPMFGCTAIYVGGKIVLILREKPTYTADNGVWLATTREHHDSLRRDFPSMRPIQLLGEKISNWQVLPSNSPDFEQAALLACELVLARDPRIGKVPKSRQPHKSKQKKS